VRTSPEAVLKRFYIVLDVVTNEIAVSKIQAICGDAQNQSAYFELLENSFDLFAIFRLFSFLILNLHFSEGF